MVSTNHALAIVLINTTAPAPEKAASVAPATASTPLAPATQVTNTPAPVRVTPAAPAPPAEESIPNVLANLLILGHQESANAPQLINMLVPAPDTPAVQVLPGGVSIPNVPVPLATNGKMVVARNKHRMEQLASCIIAMARWLVYVLRLWASMLR